MNSRRSLPGIRCLSPVCPTRPPSGKPARGPAAIEGARILAGIGAGLLLAAIGAAPLVPGLCLAFSAVCHQAPARCFDWLGRPLPVCARCLGLYAGVLAAAVRPAAGRGGYLLAALAAANALDWLLGLAGNPARFLLALPFFWLAASYLIALASHERAASH